MGFPLLENLRRRQMFARSAWDRDTSEGDNLGQSLA